MAVHVNNVTKKYDGKPLFENLSLTINSGEMVAVTGKSGCGKSTLLNIMGLLEPFDAGAITINEETYKSVNNYRSVKARRNTIGFLFQNFALIDNETAEQNLKYVLQNKSESDKCQSIRKALAAVGLNNDAKKKVFQLSGGEQQRLAMARIMIKPCDIIFADEPTSALDSDNAKMIMENLKKLHQNGKTIVIATHDSEITALCERTIKL